MEREIKFRAWCEDFGKFKMCHYTMNTCDNGIWFDMIEDFHSSETHAVMQFTGLTDKNGKEIYEGDILKFDDENNSIGKVIFEDGSFRVVEDLKYYCHLSAYHTNIMSEIIGNIYENPELLK